MHGIWCCCSHGSPARELPDVSLGHSWQVDEGLRLTPHKQSMLRFWKYHSCEFSNSLTCTERLKVLSDRLNLEREKKWGKKRRETKEEKKMKEYED